MKLHRVFMLVVIACVLPGCGKGTAPGWSQTNPCTELSYNPLTKKFTFYSNDGRGLSADEIGFGVDAEGRKMWSAKKLLITERSVENRIANVQQLDAIERITKTAIRESVAAITEALAPIRGASGTLDTPIGKGSFQLGGGTKTADPAAGPQPLTRVE